MTQVAQYATIPQISVGTLVQGDSSRTSPANPIIVFMAGPTGSRLDNIDFAAAGATPTATMLRLFEAPGFAGVAISTITTASTTATVTTAVAHGLASGMTVNISGAIPYNYNGIFTATVTSATQFTYTTLTAATGSATTVGAFSYALANPSLSLFSETAVAQVSTPNATTAVWTGNLNTNTTISTMPYVLPPGYSLRASLNDTQVVAGETPLSIALSQSVAANAYVSINGALAGTSASTTAVASAGTLVSAGYLTLTTTPYVQSPAAQITLTSVGNISGVNFTIVGADATGAVVTETLAGPNNSTVYSVNAYTVVSSIYANGAVGTNTSAGNSAVATPLQPTKIMITSSANLSGVNFTIFGTNTNGQVQSEVLAGPAAGSFVLSAKVYQTITTMLTSATANPTLVGCPAITTGINTIARGGGF